MANTDRTHGTGLRGVCSASGDHCLALSASGAAVSWGANKKGQRSASATIGILRRLPTRINALGCVCCVAACAGEEHSAILTDTDDLFTFGRNGEGQGATGDLSGSLLPRRTREAAPGDRDPGRLRVAGVR